MKAYRHWKRQYANDFLEHGRLRVMPLSYYRAIETPRPGVQDCLESTSIGEHAPAVIHPETATEEQLAVLAGLGIQVAPGVNPRITIEGNRRLDQGADLYILCLTSEAETALFDQNDVVTVFPDVRRFAQALLDASTDYFSQVAVGPISYADITYRLEEGVVPPSPFTKRPEFAHQKEIRIALTPRRPMAGPFLIESPTLIEALL